MDRRRFLQTSSLAGAAFAFTARTAWSATADAHVEVLLDESVGIIAPEIYGQFTEHLGGVIYDGIWVGEDSPVPNVHGIRKQIVDLMKQIHVPVVRWPGGCFADSYDWRDGIGPRKDRPTRTNFWADDPDAARLKGNAVQAYETNAFGTDEFMRFCHLSGAEPYLASNLRSLPAMAFSRWVEYCNSPAGSTTLAKQRAANGSAAPYDVKYWGVGNESWGCGGNFEPEEYAEEFRRFTTWVPHYGVPLSFIGSGPNDNNLEWTNGFFEALRRKNYMPRELHGWSVHYYTWNLSMGETTDWVAGKRDALDFDETGWYELFLQGLYMEEIVRAQWGLLGEFDPGRNIKLVVDEYGPWYKPGTQLDPTHLLGQQVTLRDALLTAMTLDIFNRHAEKVGMAACAQLVNCLNALFFSHEDKFITTPVFHVFDMYAAHQGAQSLRVNFSSPQVHYQRKGKPTALAGLLGSASMRGKTVTVTATNPNLKDARLTEIVLRGSARITSAEASVLTDADMHAHNTFEQPNAVQLKKQAVDVQGDRLIITLPPASVSSITIQLA
ncbi:alpha-N-arabinofuranosidase [Edaphobacter dinghuensis]|uniref:non-reducing end alpha-L-arabinofuranosidase n=1 Tax=Edaphobacter dinghuensis TaxID=1560005 RepID=A0A917HT98_9BACT|nr:alpha-L-arabinofuranosidase C-terminal domain-containing protein [Edaphobacter dinghuensis]GGG89571.1 alpha-L-arabinofuranosidase [Edaphobacter dinghuensis]